MSDHNSRRFATQEQLLLQAVDRLRQAVPDYSEGTCFVTDQPVPSSWPSGINCCTVCCGNGAFDDALFAGGGHVQVAEEVMLRVSPWTRTHLDNPPELERALIGEDTGVLSTYKFLILQAMLTQRKDDRQVAWEPSGHFGQKLLIDQLSPVRASEAQPAGDSDNPFVGLTIDFRMKFIWDL